MNLSYLSIEDLGKVFGAVIEKPQSYFQKMAIIVGEFFSAQDLIGQWADGNHLDLHNLACDMSPTDLNYSCWCQG